MQKTIKFVLFENDKVVDTIENEISTDPKNLISAIQVFRQAVNDAFSKQIEDEGIDDYIEDEASSEDEELIQNTSPKKRKFD